MRLVLGKNQEKKIEFEPNSDLEVILAGVGAKVNLLGVWRAKGNDNFWGNVKVVHAAPETVSQVNIRGVMFEQSQALFNGLIRIEKGAVRSDAFLRADFLLFDQSKARPLPFLEILENEVKAGHAATVSRVSDEQLFYLTSRGISQTNAKKIIIGGFLAKGESG